MLADIAKIDKKLKPKYQIIVFDGSTMTPDFVGEYGSIKLHIELYANHYNTISKITRYFSSSYFCESCLVGYRTLNRHKCRNGCNLCHGPNQCSGQEFKCSHCFRTFEGRNCFETHKQNRICEKISRCENCHLEYREPHNHVCGVYLCILCKEEYTTSPHYCCIKKLDAEKIQKEDEQNKIIISFDIESC